MTQSTKNDRFPAVFAHLPSRFSSSCEGLFRALPILSGLRKINRRGERGNVFAMLFGAVALTGVLAAVSMQTLTGPVTTITRVTQKNIADTQLLMNAKIIINAAVSGTLGGDADADGIIEPAPFVSAAGGEVPPVNGGYLPTTLGLSLTDPWGTKYGYCVWDHGTTNTSANRLTGDNTVSASTQPVIAVIAAGPDKTFQTTCSAFTAGPISVAKTAGSDDLIFKYTYAEASANSNGLWTLNTTDQKKAELKDSSGNTANVSINRDTGVGDFLGITTDTVSAKTTNVSIGGGLKLDSETNVTSCAATDIGVVRYNASTLKLEVCNGAGVWKAAGSDLWIENGNDMYSGKSGNVGIGTNTPAEKLDIVGNVKASGNLAVGGTGSVTGNFAVNTDAVSVIAASKFVGIGKAVPTVALDVVGDTYISGKGTIANDLVVDTTSLVVDSANNRVGVGTATPAYPLDLVVTSTIGALGALDTSKAIFHIQEDAAGPSLFMDGNTIVSDAGFILGSTGNADVTLIANSAEVLRATAAGNVGIGTATPTYKLDVTGTSRFNGVTVGGGDIRSDSDVLTLGGTSEDMRITSTGEVGIGITNPAAKLDVNGGVKPGADALCNSSKAGMIAWNSSKLQVCDGTVFRNVSAIDKLDDIGDVNASTPNENEVLAWDSASSTWMPKNVNTLGPAQVSVAGSDGSVQFKNGGDLGADDANFHWDDTNNRLGLGTNVPTDTLHVVGTAKITGATTLESTLSVTGNATFATDALFVDSTLHAVGIGTITPLSRLDVNGGIKLGTQNTCDAGGTNNGTLRYDGTDLQMCSNGVWTSLKKDTGGGIAGNVPDAINCGTGGLRRILYLQTTDGANYYYQLIAGASGIGMQVAYSAADGSYVSTINTAKWPNADGCDSKSFTTLASEGRSYYLMDGTGAVGAGGAPADATYITQTGSLDLNNEFALSSLPTGILKVTTGTGVLTSGGVDLSGSEATGILAAARFPALTGDVTTSAGSLATTIAANAVNSAKIADGTIANADLAANSVAGSNLIDGTVANADLAANSVSSSNIIDGTIATGDLADSAVTSVKIADGTVANADLAANSVSSSNIIDGTIATGDIANAAVTFAKMADMATGKLLGRSTAGAGSPEEITVGSGLSLSGGILSYSGGGVTADSLDFTEFKDAMTLDASTDIAATGTNVLSITNSGTGNSFVVNDQAADTSPFVIDASGNVGIGTATPLGALHVSSTNFNFIDRYSDSFSAGLGIRRARGTVGAAGALVNGDDVGRIVFYPYDGATFNTSPAGIYATVNGTVATDSVPTDLRFVTGAVGSGGEAMRILSSGAVGIGIAAPWAKLHVDGVSSVATGTEEYNVLSKKTYGIADVGLKQGVRSTLITNHASGAIGEVDGMLSLVVNADAGTVHLAKGFFSRVDAGSNGGTITDAMGYYVADGSGTGTITTQYGLYVDPLTKGGANYAVYTAGTTPSAFSGAVGIGTTVPVAKLDVNGGARVGADAICSVAKAGTLAWNSNTLQLCDNTGAWVGIASSSGLVGASSALSAITAAAAANTIANGDYVQNWNWTLTTAAKSGITFGETAAATNGVGAQSLVKINTLASSTAVPLMVTNLGNGASFRVNDATGDADSSPFVIDASGNVGIGTATPLDKLAVVGGYIQIDQAKSIRMGNDNFTYNGQTLSDYSLGWFPDSTDGWSSSGPTAWLAGYGGIKLFTGQQARAVITPTGNMGVGLTAPQSLLQVASTGYAQFSKTFSGAPTTADCDAATEAGRVTIDTTNSRWYVCSGTGGWMYTAIGASGGAGSSALSSITAAIAANTIANSDYAQTWNWTLTTDNKAGITFGESAAATNGTGGQSVVKINTLASSTAVPLMVTNLGNGASLRVNDETGDADTTPFIIDASGKVGIGTTTPVARLHVLGGIQAGVAGAATTEQTGVDLLTKNEASGFGATSKGWGIYARGDAWVTTTEQNDLGVSYWDGSSWHTALTIDSLTGNVGIGTTSPNTSALLDVSSTTKGFLPPRMTTAQRTAIATPAAGLTVYDTDLNSLYVFNGTAWAAAGASGASVAFSVTKTSIQGFSSGTYTAVDWENKVTDIGNNFNLTTDRFTAPVAGTYYFHASLLSNNDSSSYVNFYLYKNGVATPLRAYGTPAATSYKPAVAQGVLTLAAGDTVDVRNGGDAASLYGEAGRSVTTFTGFLLGGGSGSGSGATALSGLSDVDVSGAANGKVLTYNSTTSKWEAGAAATGALGSSMVSGWPDALKCNLSGFGPAVFYLVVAPWTDGHYFYRYLEDGTHDLSFTSSGAYFLTEAGSTDCDGKSISQLYAEGKAFNLVGGGSSPALSAITAATAANTIASGDNAQTWNWALTTAGKSGVTFGESAAATNGAGAQSVVKASTLAASTAVPLMVTNLGNGASFRVNDETGDADTTPFIVDASGNVGIGTTAPASSLEVVSQSTLQPITASNYNTSASGGNFIGQHARGTLASPSAVLADDQLALLLGKGYTSGTAFSGNVGAIGIHAAENFTGTANGTYVAISTTALGATARTERLRIDASGKVGIGTTTPTAPLDVVAGSNPQARFKGTGSAPGSLTIDNAAGNLQSSILFSNGGVAKWQIGNQSDNSYFFIYDYVNARSVAFTNTGSWNIPGCMVYNGGTTGTCLSDARLKKNVAPFTLGLKEVVGLNPVTYQYNGLAGNADDGNVKTGLIAQETAKVAPALVHETYEKLHPNDAEKTKLFEIYYGDLTFGLINAVKELKGLYDGLEAKVSALTGKVADAMLEIAGLKDRMSALENENAALKAQNVEILKRLDALEAAKP